MSSDTRLKEHVAFWTQLAELLKAGQPLARSIEGLIPEIEDATLKAAVEGTLADIRAGSTWSEALAKHPDEFSLALVMTIHAGEVGGILDIVAEDIAKGLPDGSYLLPGSEAPDEGTAPRFWRLFGLMLSAGVPALDVLDMLARETPEPKLSVAIEAMAQTIKSGGTLTNALALFPRLFDPRIRAAVERGEKHGAVDTCALKVAEALKANDLSLLPDSASEAEISMSSEASSFIGQMLQEAYERRASDIHLEPTESGQGRIRLRIDGVLHTVDLPRPPHGAVVTQLKRILSLPLERQPLPQEGRILKNVAGKILHFRVSMVPSMCGEKVVIRLFCPGSMLPRLAKFLSGETLGRVQEICKLPNGIVICTGPAGCGKTTLLHAMLLEMDLESSSAYSIEDPIEYPLPGVTQMQVQPAAGFTYARALHAIMRQDPDVVMLGSLPDLETVHGAVELAQTGHLVLSQSHAPTADAVIRRFLDMGLPAVVVNAAMKAAVAQRLVRCLCADCKAEVEPPLSGLPEDVLRFLDALPEKRFFAAAGCPACGGSGYRGRAAILEILVVNDQLRVAIAKDLEPAALRRAAIESGMRPMLLIGIELAARGVTSIEEVWRVAPTP